MNDFLAISITLRLCTVKMGKSYKSRKKATSLDCLKRRNYLNDTVYNDLAASRGRGVLLRILDGMICAARFAKS